MRRTRQIGQAIIANRASKDFANKDATIVQCNEHIANVQHSVPPSQLLALQTEDG